MLIFWLAVHDQNHDAGRDFFFFRIFSWRVRYFIPSLALPRAGEQFNGR